MDSALGTLDPSRSPDPDNTHEKMINNPPPIVRRTLLEISNVSWMLGRLPRNWKRAIFIPIRNLEKPAGTSDNFRPIALTSISLSGFPLILDFSSNEVAGTLANVSTYMGSASTILPFIETC
ncbi:hypothetical protein NPIL_321101 [Nephila pilipes]|uniref:Uncharacterized protein n=1 Tax=Nephila pilipes TaxID=299642 RepID=A0A8X6T4F3_NEPPI|nr:hypothetical protein NPIL_321101 [Nephila pilipes]